MDNTIIQQGRFTSQGTAKQLDLRAGTDWMDVLNVTQSMNVETPGRGVQFEWRDGFFPGSAVEIKKLDGINTLEMVHLVSGGFTPLPKISSAVTTGTTITKAVSPVCTSNSHGFSNGDIVIFSNLTTMPQLSVVLFSIDNVTTNTFELPYMDTSSANFVAETSFGVRSFPEFSFKPALNWVTKVTTGNTTTVTLSAQAPHLTYNVGGVIRFSIPESFGMKELDGLQGTILSINTSLNQFVVDIDSNGFTTFEWPANTAVPTSLATTVSVGSETTNSLDAVSNLGIIGMELTAGINGPAGSLGDQIYWRAGKSFSNTIEV